MSWNEGLNGPALDIASCNESPLRVLAGPGTGKTFALKRRVARLLEENVMPGQILVVTFTRMAARDLEREITALNSPGVEQVYKGTLHSLCLSILKDANVIRIMGRHSRMLMDFETRFLLEDLKDNTNTGHGEDYNHRRKRLQAFEAAWAREQDQEPGWPQNDEDRHFQGVLNEWLLFHRAMLVGELIPLTMRYLRDNPACSELQTYQHVLVDEYQDLNRAEQHLLELLSTNASLTVVGDEDQSIYESFRYAHPEGISEFDQRHENTRDIPLSVCRRCPTTVVSMANELISNNLRRIQHPLYPFDENPSGAVHLIQWNDMEAEIEGLAEYIYQKVSSGEFDPGKTLVLCPRKQFGFLIRDALRRRECSAHSFFQEELLEGNPKEIGESLAQQALTLLTLLAYPDDAVALRCWLGFGSPSLRANEYNRIREYCAENGFSVWQALELAERGELPIRRLGNVIERFRLLKESLERLRDRNPNEVAVILFPAGEAWADAFRQILETTNNSFESFGTLFNLLKTNITQPEMPSNVDYVRIMSLHKAKGLNADHVIILGCVEGILPKRADENLPFEDQRRYLEEQRRLFYVAITRAKKTLVLSNVLRLPRTLAYRMGADIVGGDGNFAETTASSFIAELGPNAPRSINGQLWLLNNTHEV